MIINLLGPVMIHPHAERDEIVVLTHDTRQSSLTNVYDGLVYHIDNDLVRHVLVADHWLAAEGIIRTTLPYARSIRKKYTCRHAHVGTSGVARPDAYRVLEIETFEDMIAVRDVNGQQFVIDLGLKLELNTDTRSVWDLLQE